jgi:Zn-dependent protease
MRTGMMLTAAAGPLSNLLFAFIIAFVLRFLSREALPEALTGNVTIFVGLSKLLSWMMLINIGLFLFNLIPIPPLDGSKVLDRFLPERYAHVMEFMSRYSFVFFVALMLLLSVSERGASSIIFGVFNGFGLGKVAGISDSTFIYLLQL